MRVGVVGAGTLGRALTRRLVHRQDQVVVASRRPVDLPALWLQVDVLSGEGLHKALRGCDAVVFAAAGGRRKEAVQLARIGLRNVAVATEREGARLVMVGPSGTGEGSSHPVLRAHHEGENLAQEECSKLWVVRVPTLFGMGDHLLSPWLDQIARGESVRVPPVRAPLRPLWTGDASLLIERALGDEPGWPGNVEVNGPGTWTMRQLAEATCAILGSKPSGVPHFGGASRWDHLAAQDTERDDWGRLNLGNRRNVEDWLAAVGSRS